MAAHTRRGQFGSQAKKISTHLLGIGRKRVGDDRSRCCYVPRGDERGSQLAQGFDIARCRFHSLAQASGGARLVAQLVALDVGRSVQQRAGLAHLAHPRGLARKQFHQLRPQLAIAVVGGETLEQLRAVRAASAPQLQRPSRAGLVVQACAHLREIQRARRRLRFTFAGQDLLAQSRTFRQLVLAGKKIEQG